jgi:mannose-6-phosphate isomerase-like protein (cupin superfamily)
MSEFTEIDTPARVFDEVVTLVVKHRVKAGFEVPYNAWLRKIVRIAGDFIWHSHPETDETLMVVEGVLRVDFRDGHVLVKAGEMIVVPRGVEHKTSAETEAKLMLIEPRGVLNTGHEGGERTAVNDVWI